MSQTEPSSQPAEFPSDKNRGIDDRAALAETLVQRSSLLCNSVCVDCIDHRKVISGKGSVFLLCQSYATPKTWPKYPPQPLSFCPYMRLTASKDDKDADAMRPDANRGG
jgi:hypothetical protein